MFDVEQKTEQKSSFIYFYKFYIIEASICISSLFSQTKVRCVLFLFINSSHSRLENVNIGDGLPQLGELPNGSQRAAEASNLKNKRQ